MGELDIKIRAVRRQDGTLHPVLLRGGIPIVLPTIWADELAATCRYNTVASYLADIAILYKWADHNGIEVYSLFVALKGLSRVQLRSLADYMCRSATGKRAAEATCERRLHAARSFVRFLFSYFLERREIDLKEQAQAQVNLRSQLARLTSLFKANQNQGRPSRRSQALTKVELRRLREIVHPNSNLNPFKNEKTRIRNYCIVEVALATFARRSELVLLELSDVSLGPSPTIRIKRPSSGVAFKRRDGASLKTRGRLLPLSTRLARTLTDYVEEVRDAFLRRGVPTTALFISERDGRRLSSSSINQIIRKIAAAFELESGENRLHPHALRTTAANIFRTEFLETHAGSKDDFKDALSYAAGWSPGSHMLEFYTRESVSELLSKALRASDLEDANARSK